jgi:indolepyruvate decarboxylase
MVSNSYTVGQYLVDRLREGGVRPLFSVPGPHCAGWLHNYVEATPGIKRFGVASPQAAGYAADGYARTAGLGAACVPRGVGTGALLAPLAGAYAERVPVVVVSGAPPASAAPAPTASARAVLDGPDGPPRSVEDVTCDAARLTVAATAPTRIDRLLRAARRHRRPVYLELAADVMDCPCRPVDDPLSEDEAPLGPETAEAVVAPLRRAESVVLWGGVELRRYGLAPAFDALVRALDAPYVTSLAGKGLLAEDHPHFAGRLAPDGTPPSTRRRVRAADLVLGLGVGPTCEPLPSWVRGRGSVVLAHRAGVRRVGHNASAPPPDGLVPLGALLDRLRAVADDRPDAAGGPPPPRPDPSPAGPAGTEDDAPLTYQNACALLSEYVGPDTLLLSGTGLARAGSGAVPVAASGFVCQAAYGDAAHALPAAMGADLGTDAERVLVLIGDGGLQMTASCLGTMAERGLDPLIVVLDNGVYGAEQRRMDPAPFTGDGPFAPQTRLPQWHYRKLPDAMGGRGWRVATLGALRTAVDEAFKYTGGPLLIDARVEQTSLPARAARVVDGAETEASS